MLIDDDKKKNRKGVLTPAKLAEKTQHERDLIRKSQLIKASMNGAVVDDDYEFPDLKIKQKRTWIKWFFLGLITFVAIVFYSNFAVIRVDGHSMDNTLHNNEFVILQRHAKVQRFDIVVLKERAQANGEQKNIIKRVIGFPGDVVTVIDGKLFVNNKQYDEKYVTDSNAIDFKKVNWTITVPKGHVFVLGDNRDISKDSRMVGSFTESSIIGVKV